MRPHIPALDTAAMPWAERNKGLYSKMLSQDPDTGARNALQRLVPEAGYTPPTVAHFHHSDEEIFVVKGLLSFDSRDWLGPHGYVFHPAETVHGFKSAVPEESWFISRVSKELDFNYVPEPPQKTYYSAYNRPPKREISVVKQPVDAGGWVDERDGYGGRGWTRQLVLGRNSETGEGSHLIRLLPGWEMPKGDFSHDVYNESFVLEGEVQLADGTLRKAGSYSFIPPGVAQSSAKSPKGALLYVNVGGPLDFHPAR